MMKHSNIDDAQLWARLKNATIQFGGNEKLKIYGHLDCRSGKRMLRETRVFFQDEEEAIAAGYRPCGHCMPAAYQKYKCHGFI